MKNPHINDGFTLWGVYKESGFSNDEMFKMGEIHFKEFMDYIYYLCSYSEDNDKKTEGL